MLYEGKFGIIQTHTLWFIQMPIHSLTAGYYFVKSRIQLFCCVLDTFTATKSFLHKLILLRKCLFQHQARPLQHTLFPVFPSCQIYQSNDNANILIILSKHGSVDASVAKHGVSKYSLACLHFGVSLCTVGQASSSSSGTPAEYLQTQNVTYKKWTSMETHCLTFMKSSHSDLDVAGWRHIHTNY